MPVDWIPKENVMGRVINVAPRQHKLDGRVRPREEAGGVLRPPCMWGRSTTTISAVEGTL